MALITLTSADLALGGPPLLARVHFALETRERVGLVGRNGSGKSTLLKVLGGEIAVDAGQIHWQRGLRIAHVAQEPAFGAAVTVRDAIAQGMADVIASIEQYTRGEGDLDALQNAIESRDGWNWEQAVLQAAITARLDPDQPLSSLSGGGLKRVALARALVTRPHVLLLDEPTNHLDLDSILWLEQLLLAFDGSVVTVTHDRSFLDRVATRIVELDRGTLRTYPGNFTAYAVLKDEQLHNEATLQAKADRLLAQEEVWIRKGVEARRTRSQSRVQRLQALRAQRAARREAVGQVRMDLARGGISGRLVAELEHCSLELGGKTLVRDLSATVLRGDKIGLIGPNGAGKTSLLKLILGAYRPACGTARLGSQITVAYFDQMREQLDPEATLEDFISPGSEWIEIGSQRKHVKSYLDDFLFAPERARSPVRTLSGGERNRLLLARLFARPANVLVLDEPTNDLDIDTLELLEELLQRYSGTVFLVSHDRTFLDNVVTSTLVHEGEGRWREYEGGVRDWLEQSVRAAAAQAPAPPLPARPAAGTPRPDPQRQTAPASTGLSSKERRMLADTEARIAELEQDLAEATASLSDGAIYQADPTAARALAARHAAAEEELAQCMARWEALAARA